MYKHICSVYYVHTGHIYIQQTDTIIRIHTCLLLWRYDASDFLHSSSSCPNLANWTFLDTSLSKQHYMREMVDCCVNMMVATNLNYSLCFKCLAHKCSPFFVNIIKNHWLLWEILYASRVYTFTLWVCEYKYIIM